MSVAPAQVSEFTRIVPLDKVCGGLRGGHLTAGPADLVAIAERVGLLALRDFVVTYDILPQRGGRVFRLEGHLTAQVVQACVVTLDPVDSELEAGFGQDYVLAGTQDLSQTAVEEDLALDPFGPETPEVLSPNGLDVGDLAVQTLILALDPYPHGAGAGAQDRVTISEGVEFTPANAPEEVLKMGEDSPFSVLKGLKDRLQ